MWRPLKDSYSSRNSSDALAGLQRAAACVNSLSLTHHCPPSLSLIMHACMVSCPAGPLVVGLTLSAVAVGAAFSAGALAFTTLILPMLLLMGVGGLASFGLFAGLGAMFVLPKLVFSALSLVSRLLAWHVGSSGCARHRNSSCAATRVRSQACCARRVHYICSANDAVAC